MISSENVASWEYCFPRYHVFRTGGILKISTPKMPRFPNRGYIENQYSQDATFSELILDKMPSSHKEQNRQNRGIMTKMALVQQDQDQDRLRHPRPSSTFGSSNPHRAIGICTSHQPSPFIPSPLRPRCHAGGWNGRRDHSQQGRTPLRPSSARA